VSAGREVVLHNRFGAVDSTEVRDEDQDPDFHWWAEGAACGVCGHGCPAVVEIARDLEDPVVPLECPTCGHHAGSPAG
jgi:hypothetical protein